MGTRLLRYDAIKFRGVSTIVPSSELPGKHSISFLSFLLLYLPKNLFIHFFIGIRSDKPYSTKNHHTTGCTVHVVAQHRPNSKQIHPLCIQSTKAFSWN